MSNWILRIDAESVHIGDDDRAVLKGKRKPAIKEGDKLYVISPKRDGATFLQRGTVVGIKVLKPFGEETPGALEVLVGHWAPLYIKPDLNTLKFSLKLITNFQDPWQNFRRGYRSLSDEDAETIERGEPFIARTLYFLLWTALPHNMQSIHKSEELMSRRHEANRRFSDQLRALWEFIESRILSVGDSLVELDGLMRELDMRGPEGRKVRHIAAYSEEDSGLKTSGNAGDDIAKQAQRFRQARSVLSSLASLSSAERNDHDGLLGFILSEINSSERAGSEYRFERIFRGMQ